MMSLVRSADVVLEINLAAIQANLQTVSSLVGPQVSVAAVVKSDAYGLGILEVSRSLVDAGCSLLFVASLEEALLLRSCRIGVAIAVFRDEFDRYGKWYLSHSIIPVVNNCGELLAIDTAGKAQTYFLNVETGLSRFGLGLEDVRRRYQPHAFEKHRPSVVLSHLACSEYLGDATNVLQRDRFRAVYDLLRPVRGSLAASAGLWLGKSYHFDLVRVGSALYGINTAGVQPNPLQPVAKLRARILDVRKVLRGEAVGYGATFRACRTSRVAIAGIGYKHGLPWTCANRISVRIAGHCAPLIGRIAMEYITIDTTDIPETLCGPGAFVELLGEDFTIDDLAAAAMISPQEALTRLGAGCTRQYLNPSFPSEALSKPVAQAALKTSSGDFGR
ncbi:alanine racemase [Rhizobium calliandrae]|uniref:Alanine racemase n=1 Tax=Rhizobium calliandrae TaxID=1312182 RepID=A0ABT7KPD9_9HYPH|nr:alanine racemase [Rhizobium calliandrae]MDL2410306.1 alanine racemase [Rhizobium calliandrae]